MNRKTRTILLGIVAAGLLSQQVQAQSYSPGPLPTVGGIQTQCVEQYPAPQTRTDVGIGELVNCWIDSTTWSDTDIYTDPYGNQQYVSDTMGSITWSVSSGPASIYPTVTYGSMPTTLTIDLADADGVVTVTATVMDSETLGDDPPVLKAAMLNAFTLTGAVPLTATDNPPAAWKPGNANIGMSTAFLFQAQPTTVNFANVKMQVSYAGVPNWVWPDGTKNPIPASVWGPWNTLNVGATQNLQTDLIDLGLEPIARLAGAPYDATNGGSLQYLDKNGKNPKGVGGFSDLYNFWGAVNQNPPPAAGQSIVGAAMSNNGLRATIWGEWQGPWQ